MLGAQYRDIGIAIFADQHRAAVAAINKGETNFHRSVHDVAVGQYQAIRGEDKPRAGSLLAAALALHVNLYQRAAYPLHRTCHCTGIMIQQSGVV